MTRVEALDRLRSHEAELKRLCVERLFLFGSTARAEAGEASDVDLFFELMDGKAYAAAILGRPTDIMTRDSLHEILRSRIEEAAVRVF